MNKLLLLIVVVLVFIFICIAWSAISLERIDSQLEHWDNIIKEAER